MTYCNVTTSNEASGSCKIAVLSELYTISDPSYRQTKTGKNTMRHKTVRRTRNLTWPIAMSKKFAL